MKKDKTKYIEKTKAKNKKLWVNYREKKEKILNRKLNSSTKQRLIKNELEKTRKNISIDWEDYRIKVYNQDSKDLKLVSGYKILTGFEENISQKNYSKEKVDKNILKLSRKKGVRYILVIFEFLDIIAEQKQYTSEQFTPLSIESIFKSGSLGSIYLGKDKKGNSLNKGVDERYFSIFDLMILKFSLINDIYKANYELNKVDYRLIYNENIKKGKKTKKYRHAKK